MNHQTLLPLLAAAAFGLVMAPGSIAGAVDNGQTPSQQSHCERVIDAYFACVSGCEGLPPAQIGRCQDACWTQDLSACADRSSSLTFGGAPTARVSRPQGALQRRP